MIPSGQFAKAARSGLAQEYRSACRTLGRTVEALLPSGERISGTAERIDELGRLVVAAPSGEAVIAAGDITHLR